MLSRIIFKKPYYTGFASTFRRNNEGHQSVYQWVISKQIVNL